MDDEGDIIYSTPLPGASTMPTPMPIPAPVPMPTIPTYVPVSSAPLPQHQQQEQQLPPPPPPPAEKPADYVYYERRPDDLSSDARARATAAKVKLQSHYRFALETAIDLNIRCVSALFLREETPAVLTCWLFISM
jgi:protein-serine/threonine kinase